MPRMFNFIYSESVQTEITPTGQKPIIIGPMMNFKPAFIPGNFSFAVTFSISGVTFNQDHKIQYLFFAPGENQPLIDSGEILVNVQISSDQERLPEYARGIQINMDFRNIIFRKEGDYESEIMFNGDSLGRFPIPVYGIEVI
ncbi:hypothetical protein Back11_11900 [Paenibacillus baekrokdamisoli]|uniref:Uncharacterized protein n=2 Tax=Paenibacillus baekrokdamisoli TaxID=1712516 RepID=A0A3G9IUV4_9BACL|nr:hypothetical protein [Paenibacillus baekrokdamisoli]MBB3070495.1 hypothetical protein [Paenibacillus baekrokdamisoli]BBH19845.1 hypothetical protein Back11_11900 [Paenibacillus baekrokdamisoli]